MSTPPHYFSGFQENTTPDYMYMTVLERMFDDPMQLLNSYQIPAHRRKFLIKKWSNDRSRYLAENCRDMDYMYDEKMGGLLHALKAMKEQPRRYV